MKSEVLDLQNKLTDAGFDRYDGKYRANFSIGFDATRIEKLKVSQVKSLVRATLEKVIKQTLERIEPEEA